MHILGSADFVGHVTMIEMKKFMITDHFLISIDLIDFRSNLLFLVTRAFTTVIGTTQMSEVA